MDSNIGGAYGSGRASGDFSIAEYFKKPQVICRLLGVLFAIIVFGCISSQGYYYIGTETHCQFNNDPNACSFGITIGVISFLGLLFLLVVDGLFDNMSSIQTRKYAVIADIAFSGLWTFFWFVCFCYLTDSWRKTADKEAHYGKSGVEASIAFSFFSVVIYAAITAMAITRYRAGVAETFMPRSEFDADFASSQAPGGYAGIGGSNVDPGPFGANRPTATGTGGYKQ